MGRVAIHPETLELKEFKPGLGLTQAGFVVVKDAADLAEKGKAFLDTLAIRIIGPHKKRPKGRLECATQIWTDIVIRARHGTPLPYNAVEEKPKTEKVKKPKGQKSQRGNHKPRIPDFELTGVEPSVRLPPQAEILCIEFNKLYAEGERQIKAVLVKELVKKMKLPTQQDPMRIFRYYFWLCVRAGTFRVEGESKIDVVVKQNAERHGFELNPDV